MRVTRVLKVVEGQASVDRVKRVLQVCQAYPEIRAMTDGLESLG